MTSLSFEDFYKVPEIKFDINRLRNDLNLILEKKKFNSPGVTHFGAIPLNQSSRKLILKRFMKFLVKNLN